jgi:hypothetical protein
MKLIFHVQCTFPISRKVFKMMLCCLQAIIKWMHQNCYIMWTFPKLREDMKVMKNNSIIQYSQCISYYMKWKIPHFLLLTWSLVLATTGLFFSFNTLEWLCMLSTYASGWQNNLYSDIQFSDSGMWSVLTQTKESCRVGFNSTFTDHWP